MVINKTGGLGRRGRSRPVLNSDNAATSGSDKNVGDDIIQSNLRNVVVLSNQQTDRRTSFESTLHSHREVTELHMNQQMVTIPGSHITLQGEGSALISGSQENSGTVKLMQYGEPIEPDW